MKPLLPLLKSYFGRIGVGKPLVTEVNRKRRLLWAQERQSYGNPLFGVTNLDLNYSEEMVRIMKNMIMIWGCFTKKGLGPLVRLNGSDS